MTNPDHDSMTDYDTASREELIEENQALKAALEAEREGCSRRSVLKAAVALAGAGAAGVYATGSATAQPSGTFPEAGEDPLLKIRADRVRFVPRSSDPSSPTGGTMWVVE